MPYRFIGAAVALLAAPAALAAAGTSLTIYHADNDALFSGSTQGTLDAGHAVVHEQRTVDVQAGAHTLRIGGLPATVDPEAISVGFGSGPAVNVLGQRVVLANASARGALDGAVGQHVDVLPASAGESGVGGTLLGAFPDGVLLRTSDGAVHLIHQYRSMTLPADAVSSGSAVLLDIDAKASSQRDARLTYTTSGLGWRAAYTVALAPGAACRMRFQPQASIANRSGHTYEGAKLALVAGQPNLGNRGVRMYSAAAPVAMAAEARPMPRQAPLGDYRSFTLPGAVSLPAGTVTMTPLYPAQSLACQREYVVEDGGAGFPPKPNVNDYGAQDYRDRPIASTLAFTAPHALPAGMLRAWTTDQAGAPALLGEAGVADTPKGQRVTASLGESFDLRASRERTAFHVDTKAHTMSEAYRLTLTNGGDVARTVTVREHPNRWREWRVADASLKPAKQTPQLLEFNVPVPANGRTTFTYTIKYAWTAQDM